MNTINKTELAAIVAKTHSLTKKQATEIVNTFVDSIVASLVEGSVVSLAGLGKFRVKPTNPRAGRNPSTGEALQIPASKRPTFQFSSTVKAAVKEAE